MKKHLQKKNLRFLLLGFGLALGIGIFDFLVQILALSRQEQLAEILRSWDPVAAFIRVGIVCVIILFTVAIMRFLQSYHESTKMRKMTEEEIERRVNERVQSMGIVNRQLVAEINQRKNIEQQLRKLTCAVIHSPFSIMITDVQGTIEYVNPAFSELTGYCPDEVVGKNPREFKSGKTSKEDYQKLWATITAGHVWEGQFCNRKRNGELYWQFA